jgi:aminopeptidase-like protein
MHALMEELFPICRSITGDGVRRTLEILGRRVPLEVHEVPTGTQVLDWTVPDEWNIRDAYIANGDGRRVVDFGESTLHVVNYSEPVRATMTLDELRPHLHTLPESPDRIPYRTSYYERTWGFCLSQQALDELEDGEYDVVVDTTLEPGSLTYGECVLPGEREEEVVLTAHVCHPSLANDNLSGVAVLTELGSLLAEAPRTFTYRLLLIPGSIGSITWLARNEDDLSRIVAGLVLACVGDPSPLTYKRTRHGTARIDRAAAYVVRRFDDGARVLDYEPWGWDERQFNSLGVDLPFGCLSRSRDGEFDGYHSSADDLDLVTPDRLEEALGAIVQILDVLETDRCYVNLVPRGEPQLGKRGLYRSMGGRVPEAEQMATLWVLSESDGEHSLLDIAEKSGLPYDVVRGSAARLHEAGLLSDVSDVSGAPA